MIAWASKTAGDPAEAPVRASAGSFKCLEFSVSSVPKCCLTRGRGLVTTAGPRAHGVRPELSARVGASLSGGSWPLPRPWRTDRLHPGKAMPG